MGWINVNELKAHPENPRDHDEEQIQKIADSIDRLGWGRPIIISSDNYILAGHGAYLAATEKLHLKKVPFRKMKHEHDTPEAKAYMIADNKLTDDSDWDYGKLDPIFEDLKLNEFDLKLTGFEDKELKEVENKLDKEKEVVEDDFDEGSIKENIVRLGDIWQLGQHRLMCGDSTKKENIDALMDGKTAKMVFTDPPYDFKGDFLKNCFEYCDQHLFVIDGDKNHIRNAIEYIDKFNVFYVVNFNVPTWNLSFKIPLTNHVLIAHYKGENAVSRDLKGLHSVINVKTKNDRSEKNYKAKNQEIIDPFIKNFSDRGDIVLDVFGGSGSTLINCEQNGRECRCIELDPNFCDVIIARYEEFTGKKAKKMN